MIHECRDLAFWSGVADRPEVRPHIGDFDLAAVIAHPDVLPLRYGAGGFLLHRNGSVYDLHAMFPQTSWGRETNAALKASLDHVFSLGADLITVSEVEGWWRSRPPRSFGFKPTGESAFEPLVGAVLHHWKLTPDNWAKSPAKRRRECRQS